MYPKHKLGIRQEEFNCEYHLQLHRGRPRGGEVLPRPLSQRQEPLFSSRCRLPYEKVRVVPAEGKGFHQLQEGEAGCQAGLYLTTQGSGAQAQ